MKMFRTLVCTSVMLFATSAFAFPTLLSGTYSGSGSWKMTDGETGLYEQTLTVAYESGRLQVTDATTVYHGEETETMVVTWSATGNGNDFLAITGQSESGALTGQGYCFDNVCHLTFLEADGAYSEETFKLDGETIYKIGSHSGVYEGNRFYVAWQGSVARQ